MGGDLGMTSQSKLGKDLPYHDMFGIFTILKPFEDPLGASLGVRELGLELNPGFLRLNWIRQKT